MCDYSGKLIAWIDTELSVEETAAIERHLQLCAECLSEVGKYQRVSRAVDTYCEEAVASREPGVMPRWLPVACAAGAVTAALAILFLVFPQRDLRPHPISASAVSLPAVGSLAASASVQAGRTEEIIAAPSHSVRKVRLVRESRERSPESGESGVLASRQTGDAIAGEPVIEIAIPADEMFPPGAVPPGMHFAADLTIAPDGSAAQLQLHPRLAGFERRVTEP